MIKDIADYLRHSNTQITSLTYTYLYLNAKINVANENTDRLSNLESSIDIPVSETTQKKLSLHQKTQSND